MDETRQKSKIRSQPSGTHAEYENEQNKYLAQPMLKHIHKQCIEEQNICD